MKQETAEGIARMAALEAVKEFKKAERRDRKVRIFQNTKKLMENYNRICKSVQEGVAEISDMDNSDEMEEFSEEDVYINSILKSKLRSMVMIAHIDRCLKLLEDEEHARNTPEKYIAFRYFYLDNMRQENIVEILGGTDRTIRRWLTELTNVLSVYLFGSDAIMLD